MVFENSNEATLILTVEPWGHRHEVPHLAEAGIRYAVTEGSEDRSYSSVSGLEIDFWCNADSYEIDIVSPSAKDRLLWEICVLGGWCGGIVDGEPCHVLDLLPESGTVTAEEFATLAVRADGEPASEPSNESASALAREQVHRAFRRPVGGRRAAPSRELEGLSTTPDRSVREVWKPGVAVLASGYAP